MLPVILIVIGSVLTLLGLIGFIALMIEPFFRALRVVFKREDDYVYYETKPGRALLKKEYSALRNGFLLLFVSGIICLGAGLFLKFSPTGLDSLLSKEVEQGIEEGDAETAEDSDSKDNSEAAKDSGLADGSDQAEDSELADDSGLKADSDTSKDLANSKDDSETAIDASDAESGTSANDESNTSTDDKSETSTEGEDEQDTSEISEPAGPYTDINGREHQYYITISGMEVRFCGEVCADMTELEQKISDFGRINSIYVVDDFAVSATYHAVTDLLNRYGMTYETGE